MNEIDISLKNIQFKFQEMELQLKKYRSMEHIVPLDQVSDLLREERKKQGMTLRELSELSTVSYATLVRLESGEDGINLKTLKRVCQTLGLNLWVG